MKDIYAGSLFSDSYLEHHGILGMKWGVRRFQREDGSLTSAGKKRKVANENKREETRKAKVSNRKLANTVNKTYKKELSKAYSESAEKLERFTGKRYYDLVDSIQKTAAKNTTDRITQKYGKLSTRQEAFLSASRKGSDYMTSMRILREDGGVKPRRK